MTSFKRRVISAGMWTMGGYVVAQFLRLASNLILTRLLVPSMFGVMSIVTMVMVGMVLFTDLGLRENVIQSPRGNDPAFLDTVWTIQILRGILLWFVSVLIGGALYFADRMGWVPAHTAYADPVLPWVIPVATLSLIFSAFEPTWTSTASRRLEQSKLTLIELASQLGGILVTLALVAVERSIWALVVGSLIPAVIRNIIVYRIIPGAPNRWHLEPAAVHEVLQFGKWVFLASVVGFLFMNGDRLMLGGMVSAHELGVYMVAYLLVYSVNQAFGRLASSVVFPAISEVHRNRPEHFGRTYYRFRLFFDFGLLFMAGFLFNAGEWLVHFLYDERYAGAGYMLEILSLELVALRYNLADQGFIAKGETKLVSNLIIVRTLVLFVALPLGARSFGMVGAMWAIVASYFASVPFSLYYKYKLEFLHPGKELYVLPMFLLGGGLGWLLSQVTLSWRH